MALSHFGEVERRCGFDDALDAAQEIVTGASLNAALKPETERFVKQLANLLGEYHPEVVHAVAFGRRAVQRNVRFDLKLFDVAAALRAETARRFGPWRRARLAVAVYASSAAPEVRDTMDWRRAVASEDGDRALALVREAVEERA